MEPDVSIESASLIRIVLLQIGDYSHSIFQDLSSLVTTQYRKVDLASIRPFYSEHQKSPLNYLPWDTASLELKFITGNTRKSNWDDFQAQRKIFGLIGISHCPNSSSSSLAERYYEEFTSYSRYYSFAQTKRCLVFNADLNSSTDSNELESDEKKKSNLIVFPKSNREKVDFLLKTVMFDFCASLLMSFESWILHSDPVGGTISSPLDSPQLLASEDPGKARKRRLARMKKSTGDFCLLAGSPLDSHGHYSNAVKLAKECVDSFWLAGALEGTVSAIVMENRGQELKIIDEVLNRYSEIIQLYKRAPALIFELEASVKLCRFLSRFKEYHSECSKVLSELIDTSRQLTNLNDKLVLYTEVAQIYGGMGYFRKSSFFCHEIVNLYSQQNSKNASFCALQILIQCAFVYNIQTHHFFSHRTISQASATDSEGKKLSKLSQNSQKINLQKCPENWTLLQINILNEILSFSLKAGEPLIAFFASSQLLRNFFSLISSNGQTSLLLIISATSQKLPRGIRLPYPVFPFVNYVGMLQPSKQSEIIKRYNEENWWTTSTSSSNPFIYSPFSFLNNKKSDKMCWVVNESVQVLLELTNPFEFEIKIENMYLNTSQSFKSFPVSFTLPPKTFSKQVIINGHPLKSGEAVIFGAFVQCFGILSEHNFEENYANDSSSSSSISPPSLLSLNASSSSPSLSTNAAASKSNKDENGSNFPILDKKFRVLPEIPLLMAKFSGLESGPILLEGEKRGVFLKLSNVSNVPVAMAKIHLQGKYVSHVAKIFYEDLQNFLPILPGCSVEIKILLEGKFPSDSNNNNNYYYGNSSNGNIHGNGNGGISYAGKEGVSALLDVYYAGKIEYMLDTYELCDPNQSTSASDLPSNLILTPGRKLSIPIQSHIQRGLNIVKARFLSVPSNNVLKNSIMAAKIQLFHEKKRNEKEKERENIKEKDNITKKEKENNKFDFCERSVLRILELELLNNTEMSFEVFSKLNGKKERVREGKKGEKEGEEEGEGGEEGREEEGIADEYANEDMDGEANEDENENENGGLGLDLDKKANLESLEDNSVISFSGRKLLNFSMQKFRRCIVERDCSARLLIPLQVFCNDWESFIDSENDKIEDCFADVDTNTAAGESKGGKMSEGDIIHSIVAEICDQVAIFWRSGRNCKGKLMIRHSILQGIQKIGLDLFLPCPISFGFRMLGKGKGRKDKRDADDVAIVPVCRLSKVDISIFNHCDCDVSICLNAICRDVKGTNSIAQPTNKAGILWAGALSGIELSIPAQASIVHRFALCFLVPGEYNLSVGADIISPKFVFKGSKKSYSCDSNPYKILVVGSTA